MLSLISSIHAFAQYLNAIENDTDKYDIYNVTNADLQMPVLQDALQHFKQYLRLINVESPSKIHTARSLLAVRRYSPKKQQSQSKAAAIRDSDK